MASAALITVRSGTCWPATLIVLPGRRPARDAGRVRALDGEVFGLPDDALADWPAAPGLAAGLDGRPPDAPMKFGFCANIAEIITATRAAMRQPARSGTATPGRRKGARHLMLRSCLRSARSSRW